MRILIAEDDLLLRETLATEFRDMKTDVVEIGSIEDFLALEPVYFTHALIDLRLGNANGLLVMAKLLELVPACRIVILTGYGSIANAVKAVKMGACDYLTKPVRFADIKESLFGTETVRGDVKSPPEAALSLARMEREYIESVLSRHEGNISKAARALGLHRQSLQRKLRKFTPR